MKIDITPSTAIFSTYKNFRYNVSSALSEYYDNSTSSFFDHPKSKNNRIIITLIDRRIKEKQRLLIIDNAYGMNDDDFIRAIRIDNKKKQTHRNKFGVGLKVSAIWFSDLWTVETLESKTKKHRKFTFDLDQIINSDKKEYDDETLDSMFIGAEFGLDFQQGTIIELINPKDMPYTKTSAKKLINNISSQFSDDISEEKVKFIFAEIYENKGGSIEFKDLNEYCKDHYDGKSVVKQNLLSVSHIEPKKIEWKKIKGREVKEELEIEFTNPNDETNVTITGIVGWLEKSGVGKGGIKRLWQGRALETKDWKPEEIIGKANTYTGERLYAILDFSEFEPTNSKDGFLINSTLEETLIQKLNEAFKKIKSTINTQSKEEAKIKKKLKTAKITKSFDKTHNGFDGKNNNIDVKTLLNKSDKSGDALYKTLKHKDHKDPFSIQMKLVDDLPNSILVEIDDSEWKQKRYQLKINRNNKIFLYASEDNIDNITELIYLMSYSEIKRRLDYSERGVFDSFALVKMINKYFGENDES